MRISLLILSSLLILAQLTILSKASPPLQGAIAKYPYVYDEDFVKDTFTITKKDWSWPSPNSVYPSGHWYPGFGFDPDPSNYVRMRDGAVTLHAYSYAIMFPSCYGWSNSFVSQGRPAYAKVQWGYFLGSNSTADLAVPVEYIKIPMNESVPENELYLVIRARIDERYVFQINSFASLLIAFLFQVEYRNILNGTIVLSDYDGSAFNGAYWDNALHYDVFLSRVYRTLGIYIEDSPGTITQTPTGDAYNDDCHLQYVVGRMEIGEWKTFILDYGHLMNVLRDKYYYVTHHPTGAYLWEPINLYLRWIQISAEVIGAKLTATIDYMQFIHQDMLINGNFDVGLEHWDYYLFHVENGYATSSDYRAFLAQTVKIPVITYNFSLMFRGRGDCVLTTDHYYLWIINDYDLTNLQSCLKIRLENKEHQPWYYAEHYLGADYRNIWIKVTVGKDISDGSRNLFYEIITTNVYYSKCQKIDNLVDLDTILSVSAHPIGIYAVDNFTIERKPIQFPLYKVRIGKSGSGNITPIIGEYYFENGSIIAVQAYPDEGKYFLYWHIQNIPNNINVILTSPNTTVSVNRDYNITAYFGNYPPSSLDNRTLQLSKSYEYNSLLLPGESDLVLSWVWFDVPPFPTISVNGTVIQNGSLTYPTNTYIRLAAGTLEGYRFWNWLTNDYQLISYANYNFTLTSHRTFTAIWVPPSFKLIVKDNAGHELTGVRVYDSYSAISRIVDSGEWCAFSYNMRFITIQKDGYYSCTFAIKPNATNYPNNIVTVTLSDIIYSGGGGGGGGHPARGGSRRLIYTLTILNASQNYYIAYYGLIQIYPIAHSKATLTFVVHYETKYPIIEVEAQNISMIYFDTSGIYGELGYKYFSRVITDFFGLSVNTNNPITLDFNLPWKPDSIWKMTSDLSLPGIRITNWQWINNRVLLMLAPGDPELSFLVQPCIEQTQDIVQQFMMIIVMLVMLFVPLKFIKDKF